MFINLVVILHLRDLRFDFPCDHKMTDEEKKQTEDLVNKWIEEDISVEKLEMSKR